MYTAFYILDAMRGELDMVAWPMVLAANIEIAGTTSSITMVIITRQHIALSKVYSSRYLMDDFLWCCLSVVFSVS